MGKGDQRRPTAVPDEEYEDRWAKTFGPPALARETPEPFNAPAEEHAVPSACDCGVPGCFFCPGDGKDYALLLGDGFSEIKPRSDHLPGGAFSRDPAEGLTPPYYGIKPCYKWAVYFRHAGEFERLGGEFEKQGTALAFAEQLQENGAATRIERIA